MGCRFRKEVEESYLLVLDRVRKLVSDQGSGLEKKTLQLTSYKLCDSFRFHSSLSLLFFLSLILPPSFLPNPNPCIPGRRAKAFLGNCKPSAAALWQPW
jgi:hypothetical protein